MKTESLEKSNRGIVLLYLARGQQLSNRISLKDTLYNLISGIGDKSSHAITMLVLLSYSLNI